ncbi:unnamed protein product [Schistosoma rodhaini]|uniref:Uncharacterized protein n=1 Tax=Schistosoma rodhaini TaxID=6188 RepID=A0AA85FUT3_9TREM|nr:unnamed protein product [Schistosoma rodhaini]
MTLPISFLPVDHHDTTIVTNDHKIMKSLSDYYINENKRKFHSNLQTNFSEFTCFSQIIKQTNPLAHNSNQNTKIFTSNKDNLILSQHENQQIIQSPQYNYMPRLNKMPRDLRSVSILNK